MIRILHVMGCSDAGGISSVVRNYYQFLDRDKVHFDIALTVPNEGQNSRALHAMGAEIFFIPMKSQDPQGFREQLGKLLTEGKYDGIHVHESETCYVALRLAKQMGIPCRIAHAHTSSPYEGLKGEARRLSGCLLNYHYATHVIGCGELAGKRVFGRINMRRPRAVVLPNAVDTERFAFDPRVRQEERRNLCAADNFVLGMVTRLSEEKNVGYAIDQMPALLKRIPGALLLIAGNGPEEGALREKIKNLGLQQKVHLLGRRGDVERLYQAFDVFLLPSIHEGFPVSAVEALASGLPVLLSSGVTKELSRFTGTRYLPLKKPEAWLDALEECQGGTGREGRQKEVKEAGFDIRSTAGALQKLYETDTGK